MAKWSASEQPWERQKGESEKAYEAFETYRNMGEERTITAVVKQLGKSRALIDRWRANWDWKERVRAYDNYLTQKNVAELKKQKQDMQKRQTQIGVQLQRKAWDALKDLDPASLKSSDIVRLISLGAELERESMADSLESANEGNRADIKTSALADEITAAYEKRKESGDA